MTKVSLPLLSVAALCAGSALAHAETRTPQDCDRLRADILRLEAAGDKKSADKVRQQVAEACNCPWVGDVPLATLGDGRNLG